MVVTLPLRSFCSIIGRSRARERQLSLRRLLVLEKPPLFALAAAACAVAFTAQDLARVLAPELTLGLRLAHAAVEPFCYLALALWPGSLSVLYPHPYAPELGGEPWAPRRWSRRSPRSDRDHRGACSPRAGGPTSRWVGSGSSARSCP